MLDIIFWTLFILGPIYVVFLLRAAGERLNQISLINVTVVALILFSVLGTLPLFYFWDSYRYESGVQDRFLVLIVLLLSYANIFFFLVGVIFVRQIVGLRPIKYVSLEYRALSKMQTYTLGLLFLFCVLVLFSYLNQVGNVAIFVALKGDIASAVLARSSMGNAFQGKYHWYTLVMHDLANVITFTSFALWLHRKSFTTFSAFLIAFIFSTFTAVMAVEKAPFAWLSVGLFMVYFLVRNNGFVPFKNLIPFAVGLIVLLVVFYIYFMGVSDVSAALSSLFSRAFAGSSAAAYYYLEFFPAHQEYVLGRTFPNPAGIFPFEPYPYTVELMNWRQPHHITEGVVGSTPAVFWTESYANFGFAGIPIVAFIMGVVAGIISYVVSKVEINALSTGILVWLIVFYKDLSVTGFSKFLISIYPICIGLIVIFVLLIRGIRFRTRRQYCYKFNLQER